jgi:hypothetical protein
MDLDGHYIITKTAMQETRGKISFFPAAADLAAVNRDIEDLAGGHWSDFGQKHHFMAIKGESPEKAYHSAMAWIKKHAEEAARMYIGGMGRQLAQGACHAGWATSPAAQSLDGYRMIGAVGSGPMKGQKTVPTAFPARSDEFGTMLCTGARPLGTAAHAVEDSFAPMHVVRSEDGRILQILVYTEQTEEDHHDEEDRKWEGKGGGLSIIGRQAVDAVIDLFYLVDAAVRSKQAALTGWQSYVNKWFRADFKGKQTPTTGGITPVATPPVIKPSQLTAAGPRHHRVKGGESLSIIAGHYYGDVLLWPVIHDANRQTVKDPNFIQPGWILNIPEASTVSESDRAGIRQRGLHWRRGH